jgi:hypothetical protein
MLGNTALEESFLLEMRFCMPNVAGLSTRFPVSAFFHTIGKDVLQLNPSFETHSLRSAATYS